MKDKANFTLSLKRNFTWMFIGRITAAAALFATGSLINRSLGPSGRGVLAEMQTWVGLFIVIFGISIDTVTYHFTNKVIYNDDDKTKFVTILTLNIIYALLATLALTSFVFYWPQQVSSKTVEFLYLLNLFLIVSMLSNNLTVFFQGLGNIKFSALTAIWRAGMSTAIISTGYFLKIIDIRFVIVSMIVVQMVALILIFIISLRHKLFLGSFSKDMAAAILKKCLKYHIATISVFIYTKVNQIIVFKYCGAEEAGIFAVALTLAMYLMLIPETLQTALYPRVIHSRDDYEITARSLRFGFYMWGSIVFLVIISARPLLLIYGGNKFLDSINIFRILMLATWFLTLSSFISPYYVKKGIFGMGSFFTVILGIISIGLNLFLVPRYASIGAALATTFSCFIGSCMALTVLWLLTMKNPLLIFKVSWTKI